MLGKTYRKKAMEIIKKAWREISIAKTREAVEKAAADTKIKLGVLAKASKKYLIETRAGRGGVVRLSRRVFKGGKYVLKIRPKKGYGVSYIRLDNRIIRGHRTKYILRNITENHKIYVKFVPAR